MVIGLSGVQFAIGQVNKKIVRPSNGSPICLITSIITDRIGRNEVFLPIINHNYYNFFLDFSPLENKKYKKFREFSC